MSLLFLFAVWSASPISALELVYVGSPLSGLPGSISAQKGALTLYVDYENPKMERKYISWLDGWMWVEMVPAYMINDTDRAIEIDLEGGGPEIASQEVLIEGNWVRSQPFVWDWCGTRGALYAVRPQSYHRVYVYFNSAEEGKVRTVRYRLFFDLAGEMVSNTGEAIVSPEWIKKASQDRKAFRVAGVEELAEYVVGKREYEFAQAGLVEALDRLGNYPGNLSAIEALETFIEALWMDESVVLNEFGIPVSSEFHTAANSYESIASLQHRGPMIRRWMALKSQQRTSR